MHCYSHLRFVSYLCQLLGGEVVGALSKAAVCQPLKHLHPLLSVCWALCMHNY